MAEDTATSSGESVYTEEEVTEEEEGEGQTTTTEGKEGKTFLEFREYHLSRDLHACVRPDGKRVEWPPEADANPPVAATGASKEAATNGANGVKVSDTSSSGAKMVVKTKMVSESNVYHNSAAEGHHPSGVIKSNYEP